MSKKFDQAGRCKSKNVQEYSRMTAEALLPIRLVPFLAGWCRAVLRSVWTESERQSIINNAKSDHRTHSNATHIRRINFTSCFVLKQVQRWGAQCRREQLYRPLLFKVLAGRYLPSKNDVCDAFDSYVSQPIPQLYSCCRCHKHLFAK